MAVPLIGGAASGAARFLSTPSGAATGGFLAGDFLGSDDGWIVGDLWESVSGALTPMTLIIGALAIVAVYVFVLDDGGGGTVVVPGMSNGGGAG